MSLKGINYIIVTILLSFSIITYSFSHSPLSAENRLELVYILILILLALLILILLNHLQLQEGKCKSDKLIKKSIISSGPYNSQDSIFDILRLGLDQIPDSIIILNPSRQVIYHNHSAADLFGLKQNMPYTGHLVEEAFNFDEKQIRIMEQVLSKGKREEDRQILCIDGEMRHYLHLISPISESALLKGLLIYSRDISSLIRSQQECQAAKTAKNQFLANISHELRTPLIGILGAVELLERYADHDSEWENIRIINQCGEKLLQIIDQMIAGSRVELEAGEGLLTECNVKELFNEALNSIYPSLQEKGLGMDSYIDPDLPDHLMLDEFKLQQVLTNMLSNAVKFTLQGGIYCRLEFERNDSLSWISISISDTGIGIGEEELNKILSPFSQADDSASRQYQCTGLGLYLCRKLVEEMKGQLRIESQVGQGSTFQVKVPVLIIDQSHIPAVTTRPSPLQEDQLSLGFNPLRVLVVDDNHLTLNIVSQILHNYGFHTEVATNGMEVLDLLGQDSFDLILMDMQMPLMDGYQTTINIRAQSQFQSIPIIAMTANSTPNAREKCLSSGCDAYIAKPFKAEELMSEIANCIKNNTPKPPGEVENKLIAELLPEYLDSLYESIQELETAVKNNDIQEVKNISHDIKGSAGLYGFHEISRTAAMIEQAAGENKSQAISSSFTQLCALYKKLGA
jgi:PAS domain S-box-containing protein